MNTNKLFAITALSVVTSGALFTGAASAQTQSSTQATPATEHVRPRVSDTMERWDIISYPYASDAKQRTRAEVRAETIAFLNSPEGRAARWSYDGIYQFNNPQTRNFAKVEPLSRAQVRSETIEFLNSREGHEARSASSGGQ